MAPGQPLRLMLHIFVVFFLCMGAAHFFGLKVPLLFIYYDNLFYAYQDRIISFTLVTYALLFLAASRHRVVVPYALVSVWVTVAGLAYINQSAELAASLEGQGTGIYWLETAALGGLALVLTLLALKERKNS